MIQPIETKELKGINKATEQIHVAAQYLSMVGEFLIEHKDNGSHANMGWLSMKAKFISNPFGTDGRYVLELSPEHLRLTFLDLKDGHFHDLNLKGVTQMEGVEWMKKQLKKHKIAGAKEYKIAPSYELPDYADFKDKKFKRSSKKAFVAFSILRSWAEHFVNKYKRDYEHAGPTRTWPHHFDHASYIPLTITDSGEVSKSIGIGLAIHDSMIDEPYFYISPWQKNRTLDLSKMKDLSSGYWLNDAFKGAVLPIMNLVDDSRFEERIDRFFSESLVQIAKLLNYNDKTNNGN